VRFGDGPLVSLLEEESLKDFRRVGEGLLYGLARGAAKAALKVYLNEGLDAFLKLAPIRAGQKHKVGSLPQRALRTIAHQVSATLHRGRAPFSCE
jgi:hypothetical protein